MATGRFVRLTLLGSRGSSWSGERWQTGINVVAQDSGGLFRPSIKAPLPTFDAFSVGEAQTNSDYDISWAWAPDPNTSSKFSRPNQIALADALREFWQTPKKYNSANVILDEIRIAAMQYVNGKWSYVNGANIFKLRVPVPGNAQGTVIMPPQIALAMSLRTGARGAGGKGRMFLPFNAGTAGATAEGRPNATAIGEIAAAGKALVVALNSKIDDTAVVNLAKQTYSSITGVAVGNAFDIQRRRAEQVPETYQILPV